MCGLAPRDFYSSSIIGSAELQTLALGRNCRFWKLCLEAHGVLPCCGVVRGKEGVVEWSCPSRFFERSISVGPQPWRAYVTDQRDPRLWGSLLGAGIAQELELLADHDTSWSRQETPWSLLKPQRIYGNPRDPSWKERKWMSSKKEGGDFSFFLHLVCGGVCGLQSPIRELSSCGCPVWGNLGQYCHPFYISLHRSGRALTSLWRRGCISWSLPLDCTLLYDKNSFCW